MEANPNVVDDANNIKAIKSIIGSHYPDSDIFKALSQCGNNPDAAVNHLLDNSPPITVISTKTSTGARVSTQIKQEMIAEESDDVKSVPGSNPNPKENEGEGIRGNTCCLDNSVDKSKPRMSFDEFLVATNTKVLSKDEYLGSLIENEMPNKRVKLEPAIDSTEDVKIMSKEESLGTLAEKENPNERVKVEPVIESFEDVKVDVKVKEEVPDMGSVKDNVVLKEEEKKETVWTKLDREYQEYLREQEAKVAESSIPKEDEKPKLVQPISSIPPSSACKVEEKEEDIRTKLEREFQEYLREQGIKVVESSIPKEDEKPKLVKPISSIPPSSTCKVPQEPKMVQPISSVPPSSACKAPQEPKMVQPISSRPPSGYDLLKPRNAKKPKVQDTRLNAVVIEDGDFPEEPDWLLVGRTTITGLSTTKGRKLEDNEIVHFVFPSLESRNRSSAPWVSAKAANAASSIVRFSTKRSGEIGRLPMEWAKCLVPLVNSKKVKVYGRCIAAPTSLCLMQELMLYISFYIHHSVFTACETASWKLDAPSNIDSTIYPLLTLFNLLKINPFQRADFTPEELDSRKRGLNLDGDSNEAVGVLPMTKRRKGNEAYPEQGKDEQVLSESSLNKLVGAVDMYNLEEMDPPSNLMCDLRPYQKQALYWMSELEKGVDDEKTTKTLHPCWSAYRICDERATSIYVNNFSGEATTKFPTATQMARGGILADAMGLGKTVMTIALILSRPGRGSPDDNAVPDDAVATEYIKKRKQDYDSKASQRVRGGTLIICPMALLGQWKDEIENHSKPESISVSVFYGGERSNNPKVIAEPDVVLTTYGVLSASYKADSENSIFHKIDWHRVVLDEAHTIKSSKAQVAQAAFALSAYCRWCLTGTPLQNNLEDLYSLLCFLHVEPWCNWAWWQKLIQRPYENGDQRGLKLIKAILRPLMLRRTKDTKDKEGRPILVLPPTDIQVTECEQSEAEHDFYDALFKRSKVQFDQFVAQGKVLHNYANILELLLRLRQCCNHPFLVMSRGDSQEFANLNNLAKRFLEPNPDSATPNQKVPSKAYVEEVVEGIRRGENTECPICLESADDPVLTPCAHRMCRDCLLSSWRTPAAGICPICRQVLKKTDLITCPSDSKFRIDVEKNWKESSKVSKLLECLQDIRKKGSGEKSIVFSQWTSFLDLLEIPLKRKKIEFLRFDGRLSQKNREKVLKEFCETKDKTVMLMSLKVGGVGLNLTSASNVFLMDPWWNPAVEEQAIMRIHRIGQKRTVCVRRFIVKDTVEERMQQVQARKQRMIAGALTDDEVRSARLEELKMLFR